MPVASTLFSREKILQIARSLPADLHVLARLGEMLQDINSELDQIAALLRRDVALAARIVRISNSPVFGGRGSIASVEEAVNRVGFGEILKLVGTASAARMAERALELYDLPAETLRDGMLYGAFAAEALARTADLDPRIAYTAGLLRPLGMMVLDRAARAQVKSADKFTLGRFPSYSAWEGNYFGIDNCEVTGLILDDWQFPKVLGAAVRAHHLNRAFDLENQLAALLNVAGGVAQRAGRSFAGETILWDITPAKLAAAKVTEDDLAQAFESANANMEEALMALAA